MKPGIVIACSTTWNLVNFRACWIRALLHIVATTTTDAAAVHQGYNLALGDRTGLKEVYALIRYLIVETNPKVKSVDPVGREFRSGDVRHSQADIGMIQRLLGYSPPHSVAASLAETTQYHLASVSA